MSDDKKPRGYMSLLLVADAETSGVALGEDNPSFNSKTGQYFQAVSWGVLVVNAQTLEILDELYLEIKWDGVSQWSDKAEQVHGMSRAYLEEHGVDMSEAVEEIASLILEYWGPSSAVCLAGHNPSFDRAFLRRTLRSEGIEINFAARMVDTHSIGYTIFDTYNSDDLFEMVGVPVRAKHNALDDAKAALQVIKTTRAMADECFG
ncbi:exonuclease domain-containing protein [Candidatus Dojkabacteria bacterium]|jgi:oligoribonuclease (3'-5' exoribonuclease)|nr:exonuclease domain-containing protein [Candidatus Dojkabacteria bacterium]